MRGRRWTHAHIEDNDEQRIKRDVKGEEEKGQGEKEGGGLGPIIIIARHNSAGTRAAKTAKERIKKKSRRRGSIEKREDLCGLPRCVVKGEKRGEEQVFIRRERRREKMLSGFGNLGIEPPSNLSGIYSLYRRKG